MLRKDLPGIVFGLTPMSGVVNSCAANEDGISECYQGDVGAPQESRSCHGQPVTSLVAANKPALKSIKNKAERPKR
ncbi:hypothetical protein OKW42_006418 [Paraburkholderia sp. WC7.3d]